MKPIADYVIVYIKAIMRQLNGNNVYNQSFRTARTLRPVNRAFRFQLKMQWAEGLVSTFDKIIPCASRTSIRLF